MTACRGNLGAELFDSGVLTRIFFCVHNTSYRDIDYGSGKYEKNTRRRACGLVAVLSIRSRGVACNY
jgi:hypothetical protein